MGSDYRTPTSRYVLSAGDSRSCVNVNILDDNILEIGGENFEGRLEGFVIDGMNEDTVDGVTLDPANTVIEIQDNDGRWKNLFFE